MRKVSYRLKLECLENKLAPAPVEWGLEIHSWLTNHFDRRRVSARVDTNKEPVYVNVEGELPFERRGKIPATAAICFAATAYHRTPQGIPCKVLVGTSHIMLAELENTPAGSFKKDVHLTMHTTQDQYEKAVVRVACDTKRIGAELKFMPLQINANQAGNDMDAYLNDLYHQEMHLGNTIPGTNNIRCFLNMSEEGSQLTGSPVPALAFLQGEIPDSNALFWHNAIGNVLDREGVTHEQFLKKLGKNEQARIVFQLIDYPITIMPYISDEVDRRRRRTGSGKTLQDIGVLMREESGRKVGFEQFMGQVIAIMCGDCEDLAKGITTIARAWKKFQENPTKQNEFKLLGPQNQAVASKISDILEQYVIQMSLCVVHGAKADDDDTMPKGAHMADFGFPVHYYKKSLESTPEGKLLASQLPWPKVIDTEYETMIGEGTGMLDPRGYRDAKAHVRAYLHGAPTFAALKHPMVMEHGAPSPFFLGALQGWTSYFNDRGVNEGVGGFWYVDNNKGGTRGSLYVDFTNERKNVGLKPMPTVPEGVQELMNEANAFSMPSSPLVLSERELKIRGNHLLDQLREGVAKLGRPTPPAKSNCNIDIYIAPHQLSSQLVKGLLEDVQGKLDRVHSITYKREAVTDEYHGYRMTVAVKVDN